MKIIDIQSISNDCIFQKVQTVNGISFLDSEQIMIVLDAVANKNTIKGWFDKIGINYSDIKLYNNMIFYKIKNQWLPISELSSGEKYLLYLFACKQLKREVIALGLFERIGGRLESVVLKELWDYRSLTIVVYNVILPKEFAPYYVKEI